MDFNTLQRNDIIYLLEILKPDIIASILLGDEKYQNKIDFGKFSFLKYIEEIQGKQLGLNIIGKITNVDRSKNYGELDKKVQKMRIVDSRGSSMDLLLWDHQSDVIQNLGMKENNVIYLRNANSRIDRNEVLILNAGRLAVITDVTDFIHASRFMEHPTQINNISSLQSGVNSIKGNISRIHERKNIKVKGIDSWLQKITVIDVTGSIDVIFWGDNVFQLDDLQTDTSILLQKIKVSINKYSNQQEGNFSIQSTMKILSDSSKNDMQYNSSTHAKNLTNGSTRAKDNTNGSIVVLDSFGSTNDNSRNNGSTNGKHLVHSLTDDKSTYCSTNNKYFEHSLSNDKWSPGSTKDKNGSSDLTNLKTQNINKVGKQNSNEQKMGKDEKRKIRQVPFIWKKNVTIIGNIIELPSIRNITTREGDISMWVLAIRIENYFCFVRMLGEFETIIFESCSLLDTIELENVNMKNSPSKEYDYEIFVNNSSNIKIIKE